MEIVQYQKEGEGEHFCTLSEYRACVCNIIFLHAELRR